MYQEKLNEMVNGFIDQRRQGGGMTGDDQEKLILLLIVEREKLMNEVKMLRGIVEIRMMAEEQKAESYLKGLRDAQKDKSDHWFFADKPVES